MYVVTVACRTSQIAGKNNRNVHMRIHNYSSERKIKKIH